MTQNDNPFFALALIDNYNDIFYYFGCTGTLAHYFNPVRTIRIFLACQPKIIFRDRGLVSLLRLRMLTHSED